MHVRQGPAALRGSSCDGPRRPPVLRRSLCALARRPRRLPRCESGICASAGSSAAASRGGMRTRKSPSSGSQGRSSGSSTRTRAPAKRSSASASDRVCHGAIACNRLRTSPFHSSALTSREEGTSSLITTGICLPTPAIGIASSRPYGLARGKAGGSRGGRSRRVVKVPPHAREDRPGRSQNQPE
jgi:hypothetical protein